jgi:hypothetical protein
MAGQVMTEIAAAPVLPWRVKSCVEDKGEGEETFWGTSMLPGRPGPPDEGACEVA